MDFAVNKLKLNQAKALCGANATEAEVRAMYAKLGGLFYPQVEPKKVEIKVEEVKEEVKVEEPKVEKPKAKKVAKKTTKK